MLDELREIAPVHAVRGNIDERAPSCPTCSSIELGPLRIFMTHIAVYGPQPARAMSRRRRARRRRTLIVCGHSHVPFIGASAG